MTVKRTNRSYASLARTGIAALIFALASTTALKAEADDYRLGPQDKVRIKIFEWRATRDEIFEWKALNDVFVVGANGNLSLPFAGEVTAAGQTPTEISEQIGDRLMERMGLGRRPDASVEVVEFRPFFILGEITQPGAFPYRPDLTILQAVSLAGGLRREADRFMRLERERIQSRGEISLIGLERLTLLARRARLEAEINGAEKISFPEDLTGLGDDVVAMQSMTQERFIFESRQRAIQTQIQALDDLNNFLEAELVALEKQLGFLDTQIASIEKELANVTSLVARGIAPAPRQMELERALAGMRSQRLTAETSLLRARQEISRSELQKVQLRTSHANEVATSLRETEASLAATNRKADTALHLLHESELLAPVPSEQVKYTILRTDESGNPVVILANESTPVLPGDTIKVEVLISMKQAATTNADTVSITSSLRR